jgi:hypothetical protein
LTAPGWRCFCIKIQYGLDRRAATVLTAEGSVRIRLAFDVRNHPHPNPLPEYRESEPEIDRPGIVGLWLPRTYHRLAARTLFSRRGGDLARLFDWGKPLANLIQPVDRFGQCGPINSAFGQDGFDTIRRKLVCSTPGNSGDNDDRQRSKPVKRPQEMKGDFTIGSDLNLMRTFPQQQCHELGRVYIVFKQQYLCHAYANKQMESQNEFSRLRCEIARRTLL